MLGKPDAALGLPCEPFRLSDNRPDMDREFETVYTVDEYYDGPRSGIADFGGVPHFYRSVYLDTVHWNPDEDRFELSPVTAAVRDMAVEAYKLWQRWQSASFAGTAPETEDNAPRVLSEDRPRYETLMLALAPHLRIDSNHRFLMRGEFTTSPQGQPPSGLGVRWFRA